MAVSPRESAKVASLAALRQAGVVPDIAAPLKAGLDAALDDLAGVANREVPAYRETGNPEIFPELKCHLRDHLEAVCRMLGGEKTGELEFVAAHAQRRAEQRFPLDALLQTYGCLRRMLSDWIRDAALDTADEQAHVRRVVAAVNEFTSAYTNAVCSIATSRYVDQTRRVAEAEGDRRTVLLNTLLDGYDESDQNAARLLRRSGYLQQRQSYCVAVARSVNPQEMQSTARAERMADAIGVALSDFSGRVIIGIRDYHVVAVISDTRRLSGWTAPQSLLADRVYPSLRRVGPAALIGLSHDAPSTSHIPRALAEARLAVDYADVANRVMPVSTIPFRQMLVSAASESIHSALPAWTDAFFSADTRGRLAETLRAYADCDMNVQRTAKSLRVHPNTIYARMQKIEDVTGLNGLSYHPLTELLLAIECVT